MAATQGHFYSIFFFLFTLHPVSSQPQWWTEEQVIPVDNPGATAFAYDSNGNPRLMYTDWYTGVWYAERDGAGTWNVKSVAPNGGQVDIQTEWLALDDYDRPHTTYIDFPTGMVTYAWRDAAGQWYYEEVGPAAGGPSLALDSQGYPHIGCPGCEGEVCGVLKHFWKDPGGWNQEVVHPGPVGAVGYIRVDNTNNCSVTFPTEIDESCWEFFKISPFRF